MNNDRYELFEEIRFFGPESTRKRRRLRDGRLPHRGQVLLFRDSLVIDEVVVLLGFSQGFLDPSQPVLGVAQVRIVSTLDARGHQALGVLKPETTGIKLIFWVTYTFYDFFILQTLKGFKKSSAFFTIICNLTSKNNLG